MKKTIFIFSFILLTFVSSAFAQKSVEPQIQRDPVLEADAKHNLEVAKQYFKLKKAYKAVLMRFEETFAAYPEFSKMDEFLYLAGMSSYYLSENKGKQKITSDEGKKKYAPEKMLENAKAYFSAIIEKFPDSEYKSEAEKTLKELEARK